MPCGALQILSSSRGLEISDRDVGCCIEGSLSGLRVFCQEEVHLHNQHASQQRWENRLYGCAQSCPTLCNPMDCSPPGPSVWGITQVRIQERVAISPSRGSFRPRNQTRISCMAGRFCTPEPPGKAPCLGGRKKISVTE